MGKKKSFSLITLLKLLHGTKVTGGRVQSPQNTENRKIYFSIPTSKENEITISKTSELHVYCGSIHKAKRWKYLWCSATDE